MTVAIITDTLKREIVQKIYDDLVDSAGARYYVGIGRSESWPNDSDNEVVPVNTIRDERDFRLSMQSVKRVADYSFVAPRHNWSSGTIYAPYSDAVTSYNTTAIGNETPYYVLTEDNALYICVKQAKDDTNQPIVSTVKPTGTSTEAFVTADGYGWKFLYTIGTNSASKFLSANYLPVQKILTTDSDSLAVEIEQEIIQNAAEPGQIVGFQVLTTGAGYTSPPSVTIIGDGTGARANATVTVGNGIVTKIEVDESDGAFFFGSGYTYAQVVLSGGGSPSSVATARAILGPKNGFGADPREDLKTKAIMMNVKTDGIEAGEFVVDNSFRQIGLIRNPKVLNSTADSDFIASAGNALRRLKLSAISTPFTIGATVTGLTSNASGIIDKLDSDEIWFHQTETTGFGLFDSGEGVEDNEGGSGTLSSSTPILQPVLDPHSGQLLYIQNRAKITRSADQTEDIKVIIEL